MSQAEKDKINQQINYKLHQLSAQSTTTGSELLLSSNSKCGQAVHGECTYPVQDKCIEECNRIQGWISNQELHPISNYSKIFCPERGVLLNKAKRYRNEVVAGRQEELKEAIGHYTNTVELDTYKLEVLECENSQESTYDGDTDMFDQLDEQEFELEEVKDPRIVPIPPTIIINTIANASSML